MDVVNLIRERRSYRCYADKPVEPDKVARILEAARLAPSSANRQPWRFVVVTERCLREELAQATIGQDFIAHAPLIVVACVEPKDHDIALVQNNYPIDVTIAVTHMALQAVAEGLGTCWITGFHAQQVKAILGIPDEIQVSQMLLVGYPSAPPKETARIPLDRIVRWETWERNSD